MWVEKQNKNSQLEVQKAIFQDVLVWSFFLT